MIFPLSYRSKSSFLCLTNPGVSISLQPETERETSSLSPGGQVGLQTLLESYLRWWTQKSHRHWPPDRSILNDKAWVLCPQPFPDVTPLPRLSPVGPLVFSHKERTDTFRELLYRVHSSTRRTLRFNRRPVDPLVGGYSHPDSNRGVWEEVKGVCPLPVSFSRRSLRRTALSCRVIGLGVCWY